MSKLLTLYTIYRAFIRNDDNDEGLSRLFLAHLVVTFLLCISDLFFESKDFSSQ